MALLVPVLAGLGALALMSNPRRRRKARRRNPYLITEPVDELGVLVVLQHTKTVDGHHVYEWAIRSDDNKTLAKGDHFSIGAWVHSPKKIAIALLEHAMAALPGSGSGNAGDKELLENWTALGRKRLDTPRMHDAMSLLVEEFTERNPRKRRSKR